MSDLELSNAETWRAPKERAERIEESQKDAIFDCLELIEDGWGGELWASMKKYGAFYLAPRARRPDASRTGRAPHNANTQERARRKP